MALALSQPTVVSVFNAIWAAFFDVRGNCNRITIETTPPGGRTSFQNMLRLAESCVALNEVVSTYMANQPVWNAFVAFATSAVPGGPSLTDLTNSYNAANTILTAISAAYPVDGSGHLLDRTWNPASGEVWATASATDMPAIITAVNAYLATLS